MLQSQKWTLSTSAKRLFVGACAFWKNNYGGTILTTLSNKHGHIENAYVI